MGGSFFFGWDTANTTSDNMPANSFPIVFERWPAQIRCDSVTNANHSFRGMSPKTAPAAWTAAPTKKKLM